MARQMNCQTICKWALTVKKYSNIRPCFQKGYKWLSIQSKCDCILGVDDDSKED